MAEQEGKWKACPRCGGDGSVEVPLEDGNYMPCPECKGSGMYLTRPSTPPPGVVGTAAAQRLDDVCSSEQELAEIEAVLKSDAARDCVSGQRAGWAWRKLWQLLNDVRTLRAHLAPAAPPSERVSVRDRLPGDDDEPLQVKYVSNIDGYRIVGDATYDGEAFYVDVQKHIDFETTNVTHWMTKAPPPPSDAAEAGGAELHPAVVDCINSYLMDSLTTRQAADYINEVEVVPIVNYGDWRDYVPVNLRFCWRELTDDVRRGIALMAMGASVGALGRPLAAPARTAGPEKKHDPHTGPCPTCGHQIKRVERTPFMFPDEEEGTAAPSTPAAESSHEVDHDAFVIDAGGNVSRVDNGGAGATEHGTEERRG